MEEYRNQLLLYLMVLIDSQTISKSIGNNDDKVNENIFDSINEVNPSKNPKTRIDKYQRTNKLYCNKNDEVLAEGFKETKPLTEQLKTTVHIKTTPSLETTTEHEKSNTAQRSTKKKGGSFWKRLRGKNKKKGAKHDGNNERKKRIFYHKKEPRKRSNFTSIVSHIPGLRSRGKKKNSSKIYPPKSEAKVTKRDVDGQFLLPPKLHTVTPLSDKPGFDVKRQVFNIIKKNKKAIEKDPELYDMMGQLESLTYNISSLKAKYADSYKPDPITLESLPPYNNYEDNVKFITSFTPHSTDFISTSEPAFEGTALIDEMLNDIKDKADLTISYQKPSVTSMISTSAALAAYDSYPNHRRVKVPGPAGRNFVFKGVGSPQHPKIVSVNKNVKEKRSVTSAESDEYNLDDSIFSTNTESRNLADRSAKEGTMMTVAQEIEDILQKNLKNIYDKVKNRVSGDFRKGVHTIKTTLKAGLNKITGKCTQPMHPTTTSPPKKQTKTAAVKKLHKKPAPPTTPPREPRVKKKDDQRVNMVIEGISAAPDGRTTYDDYLMLAVYEQMLTKAYEENLRKMLATTMFPVSPKSKSKREAYRLSKRNPETLTDVKLREVIQNSYDDGGNMPAYDAIDNPSEGFSNVNIPSNNNNYNEEQMPYMINQDSMDNSGESNSKRDDYPNESGAESTSASSDVSSSKTELQDLSNKISYNEYVNGYKHYLKFQKDQTHQNFSNLVKYQAHRHHSVDDIGKYILNKIPQIPSSSLDKRQKRFFDDSENNNMDYQEITTKSDDSWFKKHFYLFVDNGPPKKFHTSQTVELKSPIEHKLYVTESLAKLSPNKRIYDSRADRRSPQLSLDELTEVLKNIKHMHEGEHPHLNPFWLNQNHGGHDDDSPAKSFMDKLFGGPRERGDDEKETSTWYSPEHGGFKISLSSPSRFKRSLTKDNTKNTMIDEFMNKGSDVKVTTFSPNHLKEVFGDAVPVSNKETNKYGYVDIDLVPRQTAVVKLRDNTKKSRIKNFFKKFQFKKNKKKTPKPKRSCPYNIENNRVPRFNPLKKLKKLFYTIDKDKEEIDVGNMKFQMPDYDASANIGTFKHVKSKILSVDDMKKQIPNISDIYAEPGVPLKKTTTELPQENYNLDNTDRDMLGYDISVTPKVMKIEKLHSVAEVTPDPLLAMLSNQISSTTQAPIKYTLLQKPTTGNRLKVHMQAIESTPFTSTTSTSISTSKISKSTKFTPTTSASTSEVSEPFDIDTALNSVQEKLNEATENISSTNDVFTTISRTDDLEGPTKYKKQITNAKVKTKKSRKNEGVVIKSKITRFAKFPVTKRRIRKHHQYEDTTYGSESFLEYLHDWKKTMTSSGKKNLNNKQTKEIPKTYNQTDMVKSSPYTDYFDDLLMWNSDVLNMDNVTQTRWQEIVKKINQAEILKIPKKTELSLELKDLKDDFKDSTEIPDATTPSVPSDSYRARYKEHVESQVIKPFLPEEIRSVAMNDNAIVTSKDMIIQGEAKYFMYSKPKSHFNNLKSSSNFIAKSDSLNRPEDKFNNVEYIGTDRNGYATQSFDNFSEPVVMIDTTLMAYDDEVDSITKNFDDDKDENSNLIQKFRKSAALKKTDQSKFLKTYKAPIQHYTTPLPMETHEFENFLREHNIDVESVTAPLELPTVEDAWEKRNKNYKNPLPKKPSPPPYFGNSAVPSRHALPEIHVGKADYEKQLSLFTQVLSTSIHYPGDRQKGKSNNSPKGKKHFERNKRCTESLKNTPQESNYYNMLKKKMRETLHIKQDEDPLSSSSQVQSPNHDRPEKNSWDKNLEVTIINFNDLDNLPAVKALNANNSLASKRGELFAVTEYKFGMNTNTARYQEIHNELLYGDLAAQTKSDSLAMEYASVDPSHSTEYVDPFISDALMLQGHNQIRYPFEKLAVLPRILNKVQTLSGTPKKVHISSHHYKYDIYYGEQQKKKKPTRAQNINPIEFTDKSSLNNASLEANANDETPQLNTPIIFREETTVKPAKKTSKKPAKKNRHKRKAKKTDTTHKKYKYFTFRRSKTKTTGGSTDPGKYSKSKTNATSLASTTLASTTARHVTSPPTTTTTQRLEKVATGYSYPKLDNSDISTKSEDEFRMSTLENLGMTLDRKTIFYSEPDQEFFSKISFTKSTAGIEKESMANVTSGVHRGQPGSLVYFLKQLKTTSTANNQSNSELKQTRNAAPKRNRDLRLFRLTARIQNKLRNLGRNKTAKATTKRANITTTEYVKNITQIRIRKAKDTKAQMKVQVLVPQKGYASRGRYPFSKVNTEKPAAKFYHKDLPTREENKYHDVGKKEDYENEEAKREGFRVMFKSSHVGERKKPKNNPETWLEPPDSIFKYKGKPMPGPVPDVVVMDPKFSTPITLSPDNKSKKYYQHPDRVIKYKGKVTNDAAPEIIIVDPPYIIEPLGPPLLLPPPTTSTTTDEYPYEYDIHMDVKREAHQANTFTAKDVAALEVVVDLMKNTVGDDDSNTATVYHNNSNRILSYAPKVLHPNSSTNSIQVHIAIPFEFQKGKRAAAASAAASQGSPIRVRKVFSAKMSSPVDLEYQVHSFEGTVLPDTTNRPPMSVVKTITSEGNSDSSLSPGMYLLVDKPKNGYALKPVLGQLGLSESSVSTNQTTHEPTTSMTTSKTAGETTSIKNLPKVTLSKDFIAAVNQKLIEMYENMSRINQEVKIKKRSERSLWSSLKLSKKKYINRRSIDWEAVKKYFGHDRVCNCKCECNKTMCSICAASDAVIDELTFEFDNIGKYMDDHCTEIQTFFWMNPTAGQKLRGSVTKINKSLNDYYKRVKGKCQGRPCKPCEPCMGKRHFTKTAKIVKEDTATQLLNDLTNLAEDLNKTVSLNFCYNSKFKEKGDQFLNIINRCIMNKTLDKRSDSSVTKKKVIKNVYSLDNINVNIICNPKVEAKTDLQGFTATVSSIKDSMPDIYDHLVDYELQKFKTNKKRKGLITLFPRKSKKSKLFTYFTMTPKTHFKRQVDEMVGTPLISDGGGGFWNEYLKGGTNEPRLARDSIRDRSNIEIEVVETRNNGATRIVNITQNPFRKDVMNITVTAKADRISDTGTESISYSINKLLWLLGTLPDEDSVKRNRSIMLVGNITKNDVEESEEYGDDNLKATQSLYIAQVRENLDKIRSKKETTKPATAATTTTHKNESALERNLDDLSTMEQSIDFGLENVTLKHEVTSAGDTAKGADNKNDFKPSTKTTILHSKPTAISLTAIKSSTKPIPTKYTKTTTTANTLSSSDSEVTSVSSSECITSPLNDISVSTPFFANNTKPSIKTTTIVTTTTKPSFINKVKSATKKFLDKVVKSTHASRHITKSNFPLRNSRSTGLSNSFLTDVSMEGGGSSRNDCDIAQSSETTIQNPTVLILNDGKNLPDTDTMTDGSEGYKSLLLSIIQFETNHLNDEWELVAYGGDKRKIETENKRSLTTQVENVKIENDLTPDPMLFATECTIAPVVMTGKTKLTTNLTNTTKKTRTGSLFNKLASKMVLKMMPTKKKAVNKQAIRDVTKESAKYNNNKLKTKTLRQVGDTTTTTANTPRTNTEACDPHRKPRQICDIQATYNHIKKLEKSLSTNAFEKLVKNISCHKYKDVNTDFFIIPFKRNPKRWDWIRNKRSLKLHFYSHEDNLGNEGGVGNFDDFSVDSFERFIKGDDGIYKIINRKKRRADLEALERGLRNIPPLLPGENEIYVMVGDSVTINCGPCVPWKTCYDKFRWTTDREDMLKYDNVEVNGFSITIHNTEPRNVGRYTCSLDHAVQKSIKMYVLAIPSFDVVFAPVYKTARNCSYDDLQAIQSLGSLMANETRCGKTCSIRIDEPVCQREKGINISLLRATAVLTMAPRESNCSFECKRDIISSLVMLGAANTAVLSSIGVLLSKNRVNQTLTPWRDLVRPVVTHSLRKKDHNGHSEYRKLVSFLAPGKVDVVLSCPAGNYLLPEYKLCSTCPPNTSSKAGDNTCRVCPRGTRADPGASACHPIKLNPRRYDWWWYPPGGYLVAGCGVLAGCTACVLLSVIVHLVSRDPDSHEADCDDDDQKTPKTATSVTVAYAHIAHTRPLSPSRVILPRFFKPSLTSSRATDSQETKFELWKEKNIPPPLPPIDFDP